MHPTARWMLFVFFTLLFIIGAPSLVLYTAGYRFNFQNGSFLRTGVLSVGTTPRGAMVTLNGTVSTDTTPSVIKQLLPGSYDLLLTREGYHPWEETMLITSGETTLFANILLFLDAHPSILATASSIASTIPSPNGAATVYITREKTGTETWLLDPTGSTILLERLTGTALPTVSWSADSASIAFFNPDQNTVAVFSADGSPLAIPPSAEPTTHLFWAPGSDDLLVRTSTTQTEVIDAQNGTSQIIGNANTIPLDASLLTFRSQNNATEMHLQDQTGDRLIALLPASSYIIRDRSYSLLLLEGNDKTLVLLDIRSSDPVLFKQKGALVHWNKTANLLAVSDGYEVNLYDTETRQMEFLTRQGTPIVALAVHPSGHTILLATATQLFAMTRETIEDIHPTTTLLTTTDAMERLWISENGKTAFFEAATLTDHTISSLELTK